MTFDLLGCAKAQPSPPTAPRLSPLQQLQEDITAATAGPGVQRGAWGIVIESLERNERLIQLNPRALMVPASVAKIVSLATAVDAVGWDYRFESTVETAGPIVDGVLKGDLVVVGSGDPSLGGQGGDDLGAWIAALKVIGIRQIEGRIIGDDDAFEDPRPGLAWAWDDLGYTFGALFGALNLDENRVGVTIIPGANEGEPPMLMVQPPSSSRQVTNRIVTGPRQSAQLIWPEQRPGEQALTVAGSIPAGGANARLNVSAGNPTEWFASVLRQRLIDEGINVTGAAVDIDEAGGFEQPAGRVIYTYRSRPLADLAQRMMKDSINLYGEAMLRLNAATKPNTNDAALAGMQRRLQAWGIGKDGLQQIDGSGLSRRDVIAPETLVTVLKRMYNGDDTAPWMKAMPIAGRDGTLAARMKGTAAENNVLAKSGTMSNVRSLAGYVRTRDGERLAFAIMVNNFEGAGAEAVTAIDTIAVRLANFSRN